MNERYYSIRNTTGFKRKVVDTIVRVCKRLDIKPYEIVEYMQDRVTFGDDKTIRLRNRSTGGAFSKFDRRFANSQANKRINYKWRHEARTLPMEAK